MKVKLCGPAPSAKTFEVVNPYFHGSKEKARPNAMLTLWEYVGWSKRVRYLCYISFFLYVFENRNIHSELYI